MLAIVVVTLGPLLDRVPLSALQFAIGVLLLLPFGMRWPRKAILRAASMIPLHDEVSAYANATAVSRDQERLHLAGLAWLAALTSGKAVLIEGLEVAFIVIAVSAGRGLLIQASIGALAARMLVAGAGFLVRQPLARVPENTLKFAVGVILSTFGIFSTGEGSGVPWPGDDRSILVFALLFLGVGIGSVASLRRPIPEVSP